MLKFFVTLLTATLVSCNNTENSTPSITVDSAQLQKKETVPLSDTFSLKELSFNKENEQGWGADIQLSFTESTQTENGVVYKVNSTYKNKTIGFEVTIPNPGFSKLTIKSLGTNSDNFIHVLSKLYKQKIDTTLHFVDFIIADCANMGEYIDSLRKVGSSNYVSAKSQYKLFFQGKNEDDYAELFLNVNEKEHLIELEEKDEEYRPILIKLLTHK